MCGIIARPLAVAKPDSPIVYRGPDSTIKQIIADYQFIFHRLAIIDTSVAGNQPFENDQFVMMCNGEIFNFKALKAHTNYPYLSQSDCEVILALLVDHELAEVCHILDGEFAIVLYDKKRHMLLAARDPMGIRPLFYGYCTNGQIAFASEMKALLGCCTKIFPFPPGHYYDGSKIKPYLELAKISQAKYNNPVEVITSIRELLINAVVKRLQADVPVGFLLSGGLDSSLVCAIAAKHSAKSIDTFAIGLDYNPIDLKYAKQMADYLGTNHQEVIFTKADIDTTLRTIIWVCETWDVTTIRASLPMYLLGNYIRNNTKIRVVLTGEISDELFGYKYTDFAPNAIEFQLEAQKRIKELYMYDVLRADRCISANSLEARVPFSDKDLVSYVMSIDPELKLNKYGMGKYLLRQAFADQAYLPNEILWREKAAFSDAVGHGLVDCLIELAAIKYTDEELEQAQYQYKISPPLSKEALLYREIFNEMFPNQEHVIAGYWLPNPAWPNCNLKDPSARHLPNYGSSGD